MAPRWWRLGVAALVWAVLAAVVAGSLVRAVGAAGNRQRVGDLLIVGAVLVLLARRRSPGWVLAATVALGGLAVLVSGRHVVSPDVPIAVALYAYGVARPTRPTVVAAAATAAVGAAVDVAAIGLGVVLAEVFLCAAATAVSLYVSAHRALVVSYRERAEAAEQEQAWRSAQAVAAERVRIARELHDVVAHHVSLLVVQAGAVRETLPADAASRGVLDSMIVGGRSAMGELRAMLDALREVGPTGPAPTSPQPGIDDLAGLVAGAVAAGQPVTLREEGRPRPLGPAASLAAYRIVQEALTNAVRHAPGAFTVVTVTYDHDTVEVAVSNGQPPVATTGRAPAEGSGPGHGLEGMRERVAAAQGSVRAGPTGHGWAVVARLPATTAAAAR